MLFLIILKNITQHLQKSKAKVQYYNCHEDHFIEDCPKSNQTKKPLTLLVQSKPPV